MVQEVIEHREESLAIYVSDCTNEEENDVRFEVRSSDSENIEVWFNGKMLATGNMDTFLALFERALELWKKAV